MCVIASKFHFPNKLARLIEIIQSTRNWNCAEREKATLACVVLFAFIRLWKVHPVCEIYISSRFGMFTYNLQRENKQNKKLTVLSWKLVAITEPVVGSDRFWRARWGTNLHIKKDQLGLKLVQLAVRGSLCFTKIL